MTERDMSDDERELLSDYLVARAPFRVAFDESRAGKQGPKSPKYDHEYCLDHVAYEKAIAPLRAEFDAALAARRNSNQPKEPR